MKLIKLLTVPAVLLFSLLMAVPVFAQIGGEAEISAQLSCTQGRKGLLQPHRLDQGL